MIRKFPSKFFKCFNFYALLFICSITLSHAGSINPITADFQVSKNSGSAPLAVFFDATSTLSTDTTKPFHDLNYHWDFGDGNTRSHRVSRTPFNEENTPLAGHVYEVEGDYTVTLTVTDHMGNSSVVTTEINVSDPYSQYSSIKCISTINNFNGCPAGASHIVTNNLDTINFNTSDTAFLLRRGKDFTRSNTIWISSSNIKIGTFPTIGAKYAKISTPNGFIGLPWNSTSAEGLTITGIKATGSGTNSNAIEGGAPNLTVFKSNFENFQNGVMISDMGSAHNNISIVDNVFNANGDYHIFSAHNGFMTMVMDNILKNSTGPQHTMRFHAPAGKLLLSHNAAFPGTQDSTGFAKIGGSSSSALNYTVISNNFIKMTPNVWTAIELWMNDATSQPVKNAIVKANIFDGQNAPGKSSTIVNGVDDVSISNNVYLSMGSAISLHSSYSNSVWRGLRITNNSVYNPTSSFNFVGEAWNSNHTLSDVELRNNIAVAIAPSSFRIINLPTTPLSAVTSSNNIYQFNPPSNYPIYVTSTGSFNLSQVQQQAKETDSVIADPMFQNPDQGQLELNSGSIAIDNAWEGKGITLEDKMSVDKPQGPRGDIGAFEHSSN